ncbi:S8 family serine peptidase [Dysgonomonas sp. Marseille-P4677]|uniref:S8 family peptidase n=1 Tax=Dysgonomonas sp. Marseille-P4677 TaxID=2364790 RepID=UPI001914A59B|nr:S8 family serine peptidase [Dysgonomonas sp. Marseille-P4677]MBK5719299.1 S8 family serine peptidase [Dysgonomonas sp. Marseille-P4677]
MKKIPLLCILLFIVSALFAQSYNYKFRLTLKDKGQTAYTIDKPSEFLSSKAIERRQKQNLPIDKTDLPISDDYLKAIEDLGGVVVAKSKWLGTVAVHCTDSMMIEKLKELPFVSDALFVWKGKPKGELINDSIIRYPALETISFGNYYSKSVDNIKINNGQYLHDAGFKGKGIDIAVIDAGFNHLPQIEMLDNLTILGSKGFVYENEDLFNNANQHGLNVLSCIGTNKPMQFVGTAPQAAFWLLGSEDARSEFPIEEDYWATAVEYADSVGVAVVNTSLGYNNFDSPAKSYTHKDIDGKTSYITRAAERATQKGMLIIVSGGNSGDSEWEKITPPSDAFNVLTVGAIKRDSTIAPFSSRGLTADLRIKPDVMALGAGSIVVDDKGLVTRKSGTSFSSPIMSGMAACLWQALPSLTNIEILTIIKQASDNYETPDRDYGYGIPDMKIALELGQALVAKKEELKNIQQSKDSKRKK